MQKKPRIIMLRGTSITSDVRIEKEASSLLGEGYAVCLLGWDRSANADNPRRERIQVNGFEIERTLLGVRGLFGSGVKNLQALFAFERKLYRYLASNRNSFDVIHACDLDTGYVGYLIARRYKKKLVYDIFDFYADSRDIPAAFKKLARFLEGRVIHNADATIICTDERVQQIDYAKPPRPAIVIENTPISISITNCSHKADPRSHIYISYAGTLARDRLLEETLRAIKMDSGIEADFAGSGPLAVLIEDVAHSCNRIRFHGKISHKDALALEANGDIILALYDPRIPNNVLTASNKFYEGLMLGVPILTTSGTAIGRLVERYQVGRAISPDFTDDEFADAVRGIAADNINGEISQRERELHEREYSWERMRERLLQLYSDLPRIS